MGMAIFERSGTFDPTVYGLVAGDVLQVICVGGGSSGDGVTGSPSNANLVNGITGGTSSFGSHVSSDDGYTIGTGGKSFATTGASNFAAYAAGGAGGYLPGIPMFGGNGGDGNGAPASGLGGQGGNSDVSPSQICNTRGNGNKGAGYGNAMNNQSTGAEVDAAGGNGYGAGGGGVAYTSSSKSLAGYGGDAGKFMLGTVILPTLDQIAVTVGTGGASVGANYASGRGADGVVIVTW